MFTLNGKPITRGNSVTDVSRFLDTLPYGDMLSTSQVGQRCGIPPSTIRERKRSGFLDGYFHDITTKVTAWGSKKTIAAYVEAQNDVR